jgi:putative oxidoreductase
MKSFLKSLPAALLAFLFVYAAVSKLSSFPVFQNQLLHQAIPGDVAAILAYTLPVVEIAAVILLLIPRSQLLGLSVCLALLILFTGYVTLVILHYWSSVPCSCGGVLGHLSWRAHLLFNVVFLCINLVAIHIYLKEGRAVT